MYSEVDLAGTHLDRLNQASAIGARGGHCQDQFVTLPGLVKRTNEGSWQYV